MEFWSTLIISLVLAGVVTLIVVRMVKNKRRGKSSCGCNCKDCPMSGKCH
ncbi:MAG: FeoB-associated Cys-rich membrane protein [Clostridia bacterium]|nr:FeoB-associated Cys-rich membrane protein [Clostridia bacterium]